MTAPKFRANYEQLQQIASRFKGESDRASQTMRSIKGNVEVLRGGDWIGQGARKFYEEMDGQVFPTVNRLIAAMAEAQKVTLQISQIAQQAEADAARILDKEPGDAGFNNAPTPVPVPKPTPPPTGPSPTETPKTIPNPNPNQGETNRSPIPLLETMLKKGLEFLIKKAAPKFFASFLKDNPFTGIPVALIMNAYKYWDADPDGSFDWSRFLIETTKDVAFMALSVPVGTAIASIVGIPAGATVGSLFGPGPGTAAGGIVGTIAGLAVAPLIGAGVMATIDVAIGDKIVNTIDDAYHRFVRPLFSSRSGKTQFA